MPKSPDIMNPTVHLLDTNHVGNIGTIGVYVIVGKDGFALVETGPASTYETIQRGLETLGLELANLKAVLVTHIHLDHAGAAGHFVKETPATLYVHERGAAHMIDPSRLLASAERIYGDDMQRLWGTMLPVPEERVVRLEGGETLDILGSRLEVLYTPGHASHHVCYLLSGDAMFTGDAAGIHFEGSSVVRPALPPPEVDLETWEQSVAAMLAAKPKRLYLTHFGEVNNAEAHLRQVPQRNRAWAELILQGMKAGEEQPQLVARLGKVARAELEAEGASAEMLHRHRVTSNDEMTVMGVMRYWQKLRPEALE